MRSISRVVGVSINTVSKLLVNAGKACEKYHDEHVRGLNCQRIQCDEIWSFYYSNQKNVPENKKGDAGDIHPGPAYVPIPSRSVIGSWEVVTLSTPRLLWTIWRTG